MIQLNIVLEGDGAWPDLADKKEEGKLRHFASWTEEQAELSIGVLEGGMSSGAPSLAFRIDLPDGEVVLLESSLRLFLTAADAFRARYGSP